MTDSDMDDQRFLAVDIGGTKTAVILGNGRAETLAKIVFATDHEGGPDVVMGEVLGALDDLGGDSCVTGVGISCGGPLDSRGGVILGPPNLPGWDGIRVVEIIREHTGLPAALQNDANAGALAEWRFGAGRGRRNLIFITAGTGLGCGLILDGRLYSGTNDMAGEAGHIRLAEEGPEGYGKQGSFEGFCSGGGIAKLGLQRLEEAGRRGDASSLFARQSEGAITTRIIAEEAESGDRVAAAILEEAGERLGQGLAILIDILNPEMIVLGSLAVRLGERYLGPARRVVAREALERSAEVCAIVPAELGERAGEVAALCVAMGGRQSQVSGLRSQVNGEGTAV